MPLPSPLDIRDGDRPEQVFRPPGDRTEYGDLKFGAPEKRSALTKSLCVVSVLILVTGVTVVALAQTRSNSNLSRR